MDAVSESKRILIVTPAPPGSLKGNRVTAMRWARLLRKSSYQVRVDEQYDHQDCDLMIALHARRSAKSIQQFRQANPNKPLIVGLVGTDVYHDIHSNRLAQQSLELATGFIVLQPEATKEVPKRLRSKVRVVYQSVKVPARKPPKLTSVFEVCVLGHLRPVKDPFRTAMASRQLPADSKIQIVHLGAALSESMEKRARQEMRRNPRYTWLGEFPKWKAMQRLARSRLLVVSSRMEGGANVVSEAAALRVPVLASHISGSIGLLGHEYPGYFPVGDTNALASLLLRVESERTFAKELLSFGDQLGKLTTERSEQSRLAELVDETTGGAN